MAYGLAYDADIELYYICKRCYSEIATFTILGCIDSNINGKVCNHCLASFSNDVDMQLELIKIDVDDLDEKEIKNLLTIYI